ncbi:PTS glucitol/sorbitol transporter subunit IIA [Lactobacillus sp. ESL0684]|uniref:PTS glucitol/sorbitol transporter subunit IIA n=1 Tax=Lactobacillus sp. ESL0684 TaxID=2983213 RepID=UPI0023F9A0FD|nr:PTS glucitol/sorbitol transporter subunit IIA [Lactobacillus sp. ESL0684]WEV43132.1 PTS glucitol/sorbitol transporter subunit IIA [Lactobacillus sp. ESL0684]
MKWISTIKQIGQQAFVADQQMVILFGENVSPELVDVSVIQKFDRDSLVNNFVLKKGDTVTIDGQTYLADYVGPMVESNMRALGHSTLFIGQKIPKNPLANAIYLSLTAKQTQPQFEIGAEIIYEHI